MPYMQVYPFRQFSPLHKHELLYSEKPFVQAMQLIMLSLFKVQILQFSMDEAQGQHYSKI
jgi:hypothetical protein